MQASPPILQQSLSSSLLIWLLVAVSTLPQTDQARASTSEGYVREIIAGLEINEGRTLGQAEVVGELNEMARSFRLHQTGPRGRDFSIKMVWAEDLGEALFVGANHGTPHRLNDVWSFNLSKMRWTLLYGPDNPRSYRGLGDDPSDVLFKDGFLQTKRGGPAIIAHTWWGVTWDPEQQRMLFMNTWAPDEVHVKLILSRNGDPAQRYRGPPLWSFDPYRREWSPVKTSRPWPRAPKGGFLEYVPGLGGVIWHGNNWEMRASWLYNIQDNNWMNLNANAQTGDFQYQAPPVEQVGYFDPDRNIIVAQRKRNTYHFDIDSRQWERVIRRDENDESVPSGHNARSIFYRDPVSGHGLLLEMSGTRIWAYDPDKHTWQRLEPTGDPPPTGRKRLAYVDPHHGVLVIIKDTLVWVYRYS